MFLAQKVFGGLTKLGARNYLPPPPESKIELWVFKSMVDTQILEKTHENHIYHSLRGIGQNLGTTVVVDSSVLPAKGWFPKRVVLADVPPERKPERGYIRMFPRNENRNEGTFGCSPRTKTGTRVRSHVPSERKPERGHIRQNHPFTKPPFCLPVTLVGTVHFSPFTGEWFTDFPLHSRDFFRSKKARFDNSHIHLAITGECFPHSLHSREYIFAPFTRIVATELQNLSEPLGASCPLFCRPFKLLESLGLPSDGKSVWGRGEKVSEARGRAHRDPAIQRGAIISIKLSSIMCLLEPPDPAKNATGKKRTF